MLKFSAKMGTNLPKAGTLETTSINLPKTKNKLKDQELYFLFKTLLMSKRVEYVTELPGKITGLRGNSLGILCQELVAHKL